MAEAELCGPGDALGDSCCAVGAGAAEGGSLAASTSASASALVSAPASAPAPPKTNGVGLLAAPQWARAAGAGGQPSQPWRVEYGRSAEAEAGEGSEAAIAAHVLTRASSCLSTRRHVACACARACTVQVYVHAQCRCSAGTVHEQFVRSAGAVQVQCRVRFCLSTRCWR